MDFRVTPNGVFIRHPRGGSRGRGGRGRGGRRRSRTDLDSRGGGRGHPYKWQRREEKDHETDDEMQTGDQPFDRAAITRAFNILTERVISLESCVSEQKKMIKKLKRDQGTEEGGDDGGVAKGVESMDLKDKDADAE